jgi:predicted homoserine dehydrogenase-like protein
MHTRLTARAEAGKPLRVGLIGAGKFGTMFLSQARRLPGLHVLGVADLSLERARRALERAGWPEEQAASFAEALAKGTTRLTDNAEELLEAEGLELVVEATGVPSAGVRHALGAFKHGLHVVNVNVEADALLGPLLAERAEEAGVVYSLAYGDQPALICELVDWARACGFEVVCAGKGTKYLPEYHTSTPDTVWDYYGFSEEMVTKGDFNARRFNSFLDGTKSAIEMAAVANATGLCPNPTACTFRLPAPITSPRSAGRKGTAAASAIRARSRWSRALNATVAKYETTCAGVSTSPSRRRATTSRAASLSTAWSPTRRGDTAPCTGPIT